MTRRLAIIGETIESPERARTLRLRRDELGAWAGLAGDVAASGDLVVVRRVAAQVADPQREPRADWGDVERARALAQRRARAEVAACGSAQRLLDEVAVAAGALRPFRAGRRGRSARSTRSSRPRGDRRDPAGRAAEAAAQRASAVAALRAAAEQRARAGGAAPDSAATRGRQSCAACEVAAARHARKPRPRAACSRSAAASADSAGGGGGGRGAMAAGGGGGRGGGRGGGGATGRRRRRSRCRPVRPARQLVVADVVERAEPRRPSAPSPQQRTLRRRAARRCGTTPAATAVAVRPAPRSTVGRDPASRCRRRARRCSCQLSEQARAPAAT